MLSDDQIVQLLSRDGTREDMLREAWRMGYQRALKELHDAHMDNLWPEQGGTRTVEPRAEAE